MLVNMLVVAVKSFVLRNYSQAYMEGVLRLCSNECQTWEGSGCQFPKWLPFLDWELLLSCKFSPISTVISCLASSSLMLIQLGSLALVSYNQGKFFSNLGKLWDWYIIFLLIDGIAPWKINGNGAILSPFSWGSLYCETGSWNHVPQPSMSQVDSQSLL